MKKKRVLFIIFIFLLVMPIFVKANELNITDFGFCDEYIIQDGVKTANGTLKAFQIVGYMLFVLKILVPLVLIIITSIDLGKALTNGEDGVTKDSFTKIVKRIIAAIIIFFIPTILDLLLSFVDEVSDTITASNFGNCKTCLLDPISDNCLAKNIGGIDNTNRQDDISTINNSPTNSGTTTHESSSREIHDGINGKF